MCHSPAQSASMAPITLCYKTSPLTWSMAFSAWIFGLDFRPLWVTWDIFPAFHMSACLSVPPDSPPRFCVQYLLILQMSAETCPLQRGALTCPETTPAPITCIPSTLHLLHPHHPGASHVLGAPVLPHLTTTAQACLVSSTPSAPVTKQELNQHTVDERIKGRKDKKTVSSV